MTFLRGACLPLILLVAVCAAKGQGAGTPDALRGDTLSEVVVTATRSERKITDVPIPVTVISREEIRSTGASRLDEILAEQTGLAVSYTSTSGHGFGIQMEGLDPAYCLILVNGEPAIGRTAGILDLKRFTLDNVERIEIVKGPSSSLYGSDALAGVINIITRDDVSPGFTLQSRYASRNTWDATALGTFRVHKGSVTLSANRFSTNGYDLGGGGYGPTVPPYANYTLQGTLHDRLTPKLGLQIQGKYFTERQQNNYLAQASGKDTVHVTGPGKERDAALNPVLTFQAAPGWKLTLHNDWSWYRTADDLRDAEADTLYGGSFFKQSLWKEELQSQHLLGTHQILTGGAGFSRQSVISSYYTPRKTLTDYFFYGQYEYHPSPAWNLLAGLRYDLPSVYRDQLSPKLAAQYKLSRRVSLRASIGTGYKAPDFEELYLTFSNPVVGYTVLGASQAESGLARLEEEGLISHVFLDPGKSSASLKAERSVAYNVDASYRDDVGRGFSAGFFRNDVDNLIDTRVIASKTNGQSVYSYYNIHRVLTWGLTGEGILPLPDLHLTVRAGYQYLVAVDKDVLRGIREGKLYHRRPGTLETEKLTRGDYGGLFGRSPHTANLKLEYTRSTWNVQARITYQSRFGFADTDGDGLLDAPDEYGRGFVLCNLGAAHELWATRIRLEAGVRDLFDYKDAAHLAYLPGRTWYAGLSFQIHRADHSSKKP